jgi:Spy/CpxP family protein refolding chaperone
MFLTKKKPILLLSAVILLFISGIAYAQGPQGDCEGKPHMHGQASSHPRPMIPDLTDEQKEQMEDLHIEHMKAVQSVHNKINEKEARLRTLQTADKVNMSEINKTIEDIGQMRTELMKLKAAHHQKIRSLLTDNQRVFFDAHQPPHQEHEGHPGLQPGHGPR